MVIQADAPALKQKTKLGAQARRRKQTGWRLDASVVEGVQQLAEMEGITMSEAANTLLARALRKPSGDLRGEREIPLMRESSMEYLLARRLRVNDVVDAGGYIDPVVNNYVIKHYGQIAGERILLRLVRGLSYEEIGARHSTSKQAVEQHLSRLIPRVKKDAELLRLLARTVKRNTRAEQEWGVDGG